MTYCRHGATENFKTSIRQVRREQGQACLKSVIIH